MSFSSSQKLSASAAKERQIQRLALTKTIIKVTNFVMLCVFSALIAFLSYVFTRGPVQELEKKKLRLEQAKEMTVQAELYKDQREKELHWLLTDPTYYELIVRDKLDLAQPGETVVRIDREPAEDVKKKEPEKKKEEVDIKAQPRDKKLSNKLERLK